MVQRRRKNEPVDSLVPVVPGVGILRGAVNTGVLRDGDAAVLIDCCDTVTPERLAKMGVRRVPMILFTQYRRANTAGAYRFVERGASLVVPGEERALFEGVEAFWNDPENRWRIAARLPPGQVPALPLPVGRTVAEGDEIAWGPFRIRALDTPGATDGAVSYLVESGGHACLFSGDCLYGAGQILDGYSLQKGLGDLWDYHGFMGNRRKLIPSLRKLAATGVPLLVPSHGSVIHDPKAAIELTLLRLDALWRNYTAISAANYYFPHHHDDTRDDPLRMKPAPQLAMPPFVKRVAATSYAVISQSGAAFLLDCGCNSVVATLQQWIREKRIRSVEACWATHYHYDHVDALRGAADALLCEIVADQHMAEILTHPLRYYLPCISPDAVHALRATRHGEQWNWHEFRLTAIHVPGQTCYDGGLIVEGDGQKILFCGDSFAPTGLDDYCAPNRDFLRAGSGYRRCIELLREYKPNLILNQHQELPFHFDEAALSYMEDMLVKREAILRELFPWEDPNFGLDEHWCRTYPYEQPAQAGQPVTVQVQFTNHGPAPATARVEPVVPEGWTWEPEQGVTEVAVPAHTDGWVEAFDANPDRAAACRLFVSRDATPRLYVIPFRVTWQGRYLGQFRHALVRVLPAQC